MLSTGEIPRDGNDLCACAVQACPAFKAIDLYTVDARVVAGLGHWFDAATLLLGSMASRLHGCKATSTIHLALFASTYCLFSSSRAWANAAQSSSVESCQCPCSPSSGGYGQGSAAPSSGTGDHGEGPQGDYGAFAEMLPHLHACAKAGSRFSLKFVVPVKHGVYAEAVVCCANVLRDSRYSQQIFSHIALLWTCCKVQVQLAVGCWPALLAACTLQCAPKRALYQTGCIDPCLISSSSIVY